MDRITELLSNLQSITPEDPGPARSDGPGFRQDHDDACRPRRWRAVSRRRSSDPLTDVPHFSMMIWPPTSPGHRFAAWDRADVAA
jgi:hypothetical protein